MRAKESVSASYIEGWHERTREYRPRGARNALVIGSDRTGNIGARIADALRYGTSIVSCDEYDIDDIDLGNPQEVKRFPWGEYDTIVLANGSTNLEWIENQRPEDIVSVMDNKLLGSMLATREFSRATMLHEHIKYIVFIGSMAHKSVLNGSAPYCAACAGLNHFARCTAWELAPKGYRVFCVNPSNVENSPMTEETIKGLMKYRNLDREEAEAYWSATRALPRWLHTDDIASIVRTLVTDESMEWLCGTPLDLGGGLR